MEEMEEFNFSNIFISLKKHWLLLLIFIILGGCAGLFYSYGAPVLYQAETTLYVEPSINSNQVNYDTIISNQKMVKTYTEIIKSRKILSKVKKALNLNYNLKELDEMISVSSVNDTEIIKIKVISEYKDQSVKIANTTAVVFIDEVNETMDITNIKVIDEAILNDIPVSPNIKRNCIFGVLMGISVCFIIILIYGATNNKIVTHEDVKRYLGVKSIGIIPHNCIDNEIGKNKKIKKTDSVYDLELINDPTGVISESVRMIRTNLNYADLKVINVVSTLPSEGKTTFLCNLALSFAMLDKKVLVIDCDLRKPRVHQKFNMSRKNGISDVLLTHDKVTLGSAIQSYVDNKTKLRVDVLAAGSRIVNSSELLSKKSFKDMIEELKKHYDLIFMDCCPVSSMTDGILISKIADGTVYVIESDRVDYKVAKGCMDELKNNGATILGAVLTKVNVKRQKKLYGYKYDYYYSNYNK